MSAAASVRNLNHCFGDLEVIRNFNLDVDDGEFVAIVGPSGCGKSTVLRVLAGLLAPTSGVVEVNELDVIGRPGSVAYMPQKDLLLPWRRALGNAVVGADVANVDRGTSLALAHHLFKRFGLGGFENAWPSELSGGMRQRVAVLRTFLIPHPLLVMDEPFGALDALTRRSMQQWLEEVWGEDGRSTILVTHDVEEALLLADRVLVMSSRPGHVTLEVLVNLPRPRKADVTTSSPFVAMKRDVMAALSS